MHVLPTCRRIYKELFFSIRTNTDGLISNCALMKKTTRIILYAFVLFSLHDNFDNKEGEWFHIRGEPLFKCDINY